MGRSDRRAEVAQSGCAAGWATGGGLGGVGGRGAAQAAGPRPRRRRRCGRGQVFGLQGRSSGRLAMRRAAGGGRCGVAVCCGGAGGACRLALLGLLREAVRSCAGALWRAQRCRCSRLSAAQRRGLAVWAFAALLSAAALLAARCPAAVPVACAAIALSLGRPLLAAARLRRGSARAGGVCSARRRAAAAAHGEGGLLVASASYQLCCARRAGVYI